MTQPKTHPLWLRQGPKTEVVQGKKRAVHRKLGKDAAPAMGAEMPALDWADHENLDLRDDLSERLRRDGTL